VSISGTYYRVNTPGVLYTLYGDIMILRSLVHRCYVEFLMSKSFFLCYYKVTIPGRRVWSSSLQG